MSQEPRRARLSALAKINPSLRVLHKSEGVVHIRRVPYDVASAAKKILDAGLPEPLAIRLELGK